MADGKKRNSGQNGKFTSKPGDFVFVSEAQFKRSVKKPKTSASKKK